MGWSSRKKFTSLEYGQGRSQGGSHFPETPLEERNLFICRGGEMNNVRSEVGLVIDNSIYGLVRQGKWKHHDGSEVNAMAAKRV